MIARRSFLLATTAGMIGVSSIMVSGRSQRTAAPSRNLMGVKALVFDTFGTVVDWRTSVAKQVADLAEQKELTIDATKFADAWRAGYAPAMNRVRTGELPWTKLDGLHRIILDRVLVDFGMAGRLSEAEIQTLNHA